MAEGEWVTAKAVIVKLAQARGAPASWDYSGRCRSEAGVRGEIVHPPDCRAGPKAIRFKVVWGSSQGDGDSLRVLPIA